MAQDQNSLRSISEPETVPTLVQTSGDCLYDAFISYRHSARQANIVRALQLALHGFAKPWFRLRAVRIYRDETNLSVRPDLWAAIETALDQSRYLILVASPEAATSHWVEKEVAHWLATKGPTKMLIIVTDGLVVWDKENARFDRSITTSLPPSAFDYIREEPFWLDLTWVGDDPRMLKLENAAFLDVVASLAATLRGTNKDAITGEDRRQRRRSMRLAVAGLCLIGVLAVGTAVAATAFFQQKRQAERERDIAVARLLASEGFRRGAADPRRGVPYFLASLEMVEAPNALSGLAAMLQNDPHLVLLQRTLRDQPSTVNISTSADTVSIGFESGGIELWRFGEHPKTDAGAESKPTETVFPGYGSPVAAVAYSDEPYGGVLAVDMDGRVFYGHMPVGVTIQQLPIVASLGSPVRRDVWFEWRPYAAVSANAAVVAADTDAGLILWSRTPGLRKIDRMYGPVALSPDGRLLAARLDEGVGVTATNFKIEAGPRPRPERLPPLSDEAGFPTGLMFDPGGEYVAVGMSNAQIGVFKLKPEPRVMRVIKTDEDPMRSLAAGSEVVTLSLSAQGEYLAAIYRGFWYIWHVKTGTQIGRPEPVYQPFGVFHPQRRMLLVMRPENAVGFLDFSTQHLKHIACLAAADGLTPKELQEITGQVRPSHPCR